MQRNRSAWDSTRNDTPYQAGICTAVIGSMTQAMKAQNLLAEAAIRAHISKISSSGAAGGCA
jgi:hypothetical protein